MTIPAWIRSQRRDRGLCEWCGEGPQDTEWGAGGPLICFGCCEKRQAAYAERCTS